MGKRPDRKGFEREVLGHMDALYNTALRLTHSEASAGDLVQDTYVKALRFWESYEQGTNSKAWIFKVMMNLFYTGYSRKEHEREVMELRPFEPDETAADIGLDIPELCDPEGFLIDRIFDDEVKRAIEELPADFRTVLILSDLEDMTYREIADVLNIPPGTVMSRLSRARRIMKDKLLAIAIERGVVKEKGSNKVADLDEYRKRRAAGGEG
ncbi:MAG: sigma-70 family RNA polymerase sigma factor [Myxococcota bacterium]|jgi:RNA polymerase sigma-70 factor (ECF subfamily)